MSVFTMGGMVATRESAKLLLRRWRHEDHAELQRLWGNPAVRRGRELSPGRIAAPSGDDTYVVDDAGDTVVEAVNEGTDRVEGSVSYALAGNAERLTLTGGLALDGTGNGLDNTLTGNGAANRLSGGAGADTMAGGAGDDTPDLDPLDLIISRQSESLRIAVHGASDRVDVSAWYTGVANQVEVFQAGDGRQLLSTQVEQLIQAMASYGTQSGLAWEQAVAQRPEEVEAILAAHWQAAAASGA